MKAPGGFDHRGDDEAGEGGGDAIEGGGGNASQKLKLREHLFALSMPLFSCIVSLLQPTTPSSLLLLSICWFTCSLYVGPFKWNSTTPALISLPYALYALPTVHHVHESTQGRGCILVTHQSLSLHRPG